MGKKIDGVWFTAGVDHKYMRKAASFKAVEEDVRRIFGNDFRNIATAGKVYDETNYINLVDCYVFIKCVNYHSHLNELRKSKKISFVLDTYENPTFIDESEVLGFLQKSENHESGGRLVFGDVVKIKNGKFRDLHGVVFRYLGRNTYKVFINTFTKSMFAYIDARHFEPTGNNMEIVIEKRKRPKRDDADL